MTVSKCCGKLAVEDLLPENKEGKIAGWFCTACGKPCEAVEEKPNIPEGLFAISMDLKPTTLPDSGRLLTVKEMNAIYEEWFKLEVKSFEGLMVMVATAQRDLTASLKDGVILQLQQEISELKKKLDK